MKHAGRHIYKGRGTVASDTVGWDEYELGGNSSNGTTARDGDYLLPDILPYDPRRPASFPDNGRTLTDDVVDFFFSILTNGKVTGDKVGPHDNLLDEFPYLGPPHD